MQARMMITLMILLTAGANATMEDLEGANAHLPVKKVVLYKHGVGYFERQGQAAGGSEVDLFFKAEQMNDLLKSLVAIDLGGENVQSIVYDSTKTTEQLLGDYTFELTRDMGLPGILGQLQGSEIVYELVDGQDGRGTVMGIERRVSVQDDATEQHFLLTVLESDGRMVSRAMDEVAAVRFTDERLNKDVQRYMQTLFQQHRRDEKKVTLLPGGAGMRDLLVGYVMETPVWKASYRVVLDEDEQDTLHLQGWAIVDNVSEEDWENVELSLVSGLPVSFVQNLYDPIYKQRPVVAVDTRAAVAPTMPEAEGFAYGAADGRMAKSDPKNARRRKQLARGVVADDRAVAFNMAAPAPMIGAELKANVMRELQAQAVTREVGELFEYRIDHPVSIARNRSALLPIASADVEGGKVALYNESVRRENPMAALRLKNTTGLTLEGGPLTVYQEASYVGEGLAETIKADETRYITYAVDLGLRVEPRHDSKTEDVFRVLIRRGTMHLHRYVLETKTYNLKNLDDRAKTVVVEHPRRHGWNLLAPTQPKEKTDNQYRFETTVAAGAEGKLQVREKRDSVETVALVNEAPQRILFFARQQYLDKNTRKTLENIAELKNRLVKIESEMQQIREEREKISKDQKHLSELRSRLRETSEERTQAARFVKKIGDLLTRQEEIDQRLETLEQEQRQVQQHLDELMGTLSVDHTL